MISYSIYLLVYVLNAKNYCLKKIEHFKLLGSLINQDSRYDMKIRSRIAHAKLAFINKRKCLCFNSKNIRVKNKNKNMRMQCDAVQLQNLGTKLGKTTNSRKF
jgi:hypothetical protein